MKKKSFLALAGVIILGLVFVAAGCGGVADDDSGKVTINIGDTPYVHSMVSTYILENIAEELGYNTEMVEADIGFMYQGLAQGDVDIYSDVWFPTLHKPYLEKYEGKFEIAGTLYEKADLGWTVPAYVDIDSIEELKGRADEFDSRIVGYEPSSGLMLASEEAIEAYGLEEYELIEGSVPTMMAEVDKVIKNKGNIIFLGYRPHSMWIKYDIKILKDPKGVFEIDDVRTAVSLDLKEKAPDLYQFIQNFSMPIVEVEKMILRVEEEKRDVEVLAKEWIEENRTLVDEMLEK